MHLFLLLALALTPAEERIAKAVDARQQTDEALLERIVNINSGSLNAAGVRQVADVLKPEFERLGFNVRLVDMSAAQRGPHLIAERRGTRGKRVLLIGHLDTVFEPSHPFQRYSRQGKQAIGPGVNDMKGGDVIILSALNALHENGALDGATITVVLTGDEEKPGAPLSFVRRDLIAAGKQSDVALCFEGTARRNGVDYITIARRSSSGWTLRVSSATGHSSQIFSEAMGHGAIYEIARILNDFEKELREPMLTYSPGLIVGGTDIQLAASGENGSAAGKDNVVAREAAATGDIRVITPDQLSRTQTKMKAIVARHAPTTKAEITFDEGYPPMAPTAGNRKLAVQLNEVNRALGFPEEPELSPLERGAGDISFVAADVDALSGLGMSGENSHATGESADLDRLPIYAKRAALLIYRLTR